MQSAPVQHQFMLEVEKSFENEHMDFEIKPDGKTVYLSFQFANIVYGKPINDKYGHGAVNGILENPKHKSTLEKYGIYHMTTQRKAIVPAMTFLGLKELLNHLKGPLADNYRAYCIDITTRVEAGDSSMKHVIDANAVSSNMLNQMARDALPHLAASVRPSLAAPPELVRGNGFFCALVLCCCCVVVLLCACVVVLLRHLRHHAIPKAPRPQVLDVQEAGASDVGFKRKTDDDNEMYDWQKDPRAFLVLSKQYQKNNDVTTKLIKGAEAKVMISKGDAEAYAIRTNADGKKRIDDAKAAKLEFELEQMKIAAGIDTNTKKPTTSKHETPQERARKDAKNKKAREDRVKNRTAKNNPPTSPKADA